MKTLLAILGFIVGNIFGVAILAAYSAATDTKMENPFVLSTILGVVCALIGYNKKRTE